MDHILNNLEILTLFCFYFTFRRNYNSNEYYTKTDLSNDQIIESLI